MALDLTYDRINADFNDTLLLEETSYTRSYSHFIKYFADIDPVEIHHLIIASHFVYGWMPTVINLNLQKEVQVLISLNEAKQGKVLNEQELEVVKECINNSIVGASKLLHFLNPDTYAIWDSRIFRYLTGKSSTYGIDKAITYLEYLNALNMVKEHKDYPVLHDRVEARVKKKITHMCAIEMIMFATDIKNSKI